MDPIILAAAGFLIAGLFSIVAYFLRKKDEDQEKQIKLLWEKHDIDAAALATLKLEMAKEVYLKGEIDGRFEKIEVVLREEMRALGNKFDSLASTLLNHVRWEEVEKYKRDNGHNG